MVPRAYLRVFEPIDAFPPFERGWWQDYVDAGGGLTRRQAAEAEARASVARLLGSGAGRGVAGLSGEVALVRRVGKRIHVCPLELELRAATALRRFRQDVPRQLVDAFLPDGDTQASLEALEGSARPPHIRESAWTVPLEWFVLFDPSERHFTDPAEGRGPRLTYLTSVGQANDRLERVMDVVEAHLDNVDDIVEALIDLADWADEFDEKSLLELDYAAIATFGSREALANDATCADIWHAVESLTAGDGLAAAAHYGVARSRWSRLADMRSAN